MADDKDDKDKLKLIVGVSSGIYSVARSSELGSVVRKLGFALTRGANVIEIGGDVPHEIDYTQGKELRYIAEKQNVTINLHGSLTVPMGMVERVQWRDAQDHIEKSVKSAVMGGCKYVNFHACLHFWLELMTTAGRKLTFTLCDHEGNAISKIFDDSNGNPAAQGMLRDWFVEKYEWHDHRGPAGILDKYDFEKITKEIDEEWTESKKKDLIDKLNERKNNGEIGDDDHRSLVAQITAATAERLPGFDDKRRKLAEDKVLLKLKDGKPWAEPELRRFGVELIDGYKIITQYLYYNNDPIWKAMSDVYKDVIKKYSSLKHSDGDTYVYSPGKTTNNKTDYWLDAAWDQAEKNNDRDFKEFFYAVCAAKFIEGHIKSALNWMKEDNENGLIADIKKETGDNDEEFDKLKKVAKDLEITLEIPDARSPEYAGLYLICRPKQIYAAIKTIREQLDTKKLFMLIDFEHIATQGFDALNEIKDFVKLAPDAGKYINALHVTKPTPLHHHIQVEIGDVGIYRLLWALVDKSELGKEHDTYLIYERGGDRDPFKQSVTALRLMVDQLQKGTKPEDLVGKPEFFGMSGASIGTEQRQRAIISEHTEDPIDGLLVVAEEGHTFIGRAATSKPGVTPDKWKKEELK